MRAAVRGPAGDRSPAPCYHIRMEESRTYSLKLYDAVIATFRLVRDERGVVSCVSCDAPCTDLLPFGVDGTPASFERWARSRTISRNRTFASRIVRQYGIRLGDPIQTFDACAGLSLNDAYWVVPEGDTRTFASQNLYENPFDELVATVAFSGVLDTSRLASGLSGELTTSGQFPKAWRIVDGERMLYKAGAPNSNGLEPHAEHYAAQLAHALGIPHATYDLDRWHGTLCSVCPLFTSIDVGFAPFSSMFAPCSFDDMLGVYRGLGEEASARFAEMVVLDALTANDDRHLGNFGMLFDNRTRQVLSAAPVFDNNLALFVRDIDAGLSAAELADAAAWYKSPANVLLDYQARRVMTDDLRDRLAPLRSFSFFPHPTLPLPERLTELLNAYVRLRAAHLISLPPL